jgi:hypothetical protein
MRWRLHPDPVRLALYRLIRPMGFFRMPNRSGVPGLARTRAGLAYTMVYGQACCGHDAADVDGRREAVKQLHGKIRHG